MQGPRRRLCGDGLALGPCRAPLQTMSQSLWGFEEGCLGLGGPQKSGCGGLVCAFWGPPGPWGLFEAGWKSHRRPVGRPSGQALSKASWFLVVGLAEVAPTQTPPHVILFALVGWVCARAFNQLHLHFSRGALDGAPNPALLFELAQVWGRV